MSLRLWWRARRAREAASVDDKNSDSMNISLAQILPAGPALYGRQAELSEMSASTGSVRLVSGPPGVGKSALLVACVTQLRTNENRSAVANPVGLEHRSGALQAALLESLGVALAGFESTQTVAERWGQVFNNALERTADAKAQDLIRGATAFMNGVVRARLGDPAADALESFEVNVMSSIDEQLARRIEADADPGAIAAFRALAEEVAVLVGEPVVLTIDRGERLSEDDFRMLLDLVERMPNGVHVNVGHTNRHASDEDRIRRILEAGGAFAGPSQRLHHFKLEGLPEAAVAEWMAARGLNPEHGDDANLFEVMRVTAGYPLHVDLAIKAIVAGKRLGELTGDDALLSMMASNYRQGLTADDQRAVMLLAAFSDRPDDGLILELLDADAQGWSVLQRRLTDARFLVAYTTDGRPWFHELARRLLWDNVLSPDQREQASRAAIVPLLDSITAAGSARISHCVDVARLAALVPDEVTGPHGSVQLL